MTFFRLIRFLILEKEVFVPDLGRLNIFMEITDLK